MESKSSIKWKKPIVCKSTKSQKMILAREVGPGPAAYPLPNTIGSFKRYDKRKSTSPAYTIKGRTNFVFKKEGPGPGAYDIPTGLTRTGWNRGCEFSCGPKLPPTKDYNKSPAPIYYPKLPACKSKITIGKKLKPLPADPSPAPNAYTMPDTIGYELPVYPSLNGFVLKGRVKFGSYNQPQMVPGPFQLPEMEFWKTNAPQMVIGVRTKVNNKTPGPGPAYSPVRPSAFRKRSPGYYFGCRHSTFVVPFSLKE